MGTVVVGDPPVEVAWLIKRRQALGQDLFDEVWEGEYHVVPAPSGKHGDVGDQLVCILSPRARRAGLRGSGICNIGEPEDYRVPDHAYFADRTMRSFYPTAEIVVEIVSPGDESRQKFDFYFTHGVAELLIVDPDNRTVEWFARDEAGFRPVDGSKLLAISAVELAESINWPG